MELNSKNDIKAYIKSNLPYSFSRASSVDYVEFRKKYRDISNYATKISKSFLNPETIRYQSILMYSSLVGLFVSFGGTSNINILNQKIEANDNFMLMLVAFILIISLVFVAKSRLDYQVHKIECGRDDYDLIETAEFLDGGILNQQVDNIFWNELFDRIGETYKEYYEAQSYVINGKDEKFTHTSIQENGMLVLDELIEIDSLKVPIQMKKEFLGEILHFLKEDVSKLNLHISEIVDKFDKLDKTDISHYFSDNSFSDIDNAFGKTLRKWFDARSELSSEQLDGVISSWKTNEVTMSLLQNSQQRTGEVCSSPSNMHK